MATLPSPLRRGKQIHRTDCLKELVATGSEQLWLLLLVINNRLYKAVLQRLFHVRLSRSDPSQQLLSFTFLLVWVPLSRSAAPQGQATGTSTQCPSSNSGSWVPFGHATCGAKWGKQGC